MRAIVSIICAVVLSSSAVRADETAPEPCDRARELAGYITELVAVSDLLERKADAACKARDRRTCRRMIRELVELLDWIESLNAQRHEAMHACKATAERK